MFSLANDVNFFSEKGAMEKLGIDFDWRLSVYSLIVCFYQPRTGMVMGWVVMLLLFFWEHLSFDVIFSSLFQILEFSRF